MTMSKTDFTKAYRYGQTVSKLRARPSVAEVNAVRTKFISQMAKGGVKFLGTGVLSFDQREKVWIWWGDFKRVR